MKRILILLLVLLFYQAQAGDTLTRAQVYNFNVGDTFDYRYYSSQINKSPADTVISTTYSRYVVTGIDYFADSSAKYIDELRLYPPPATSDTLVLQYLSGQEAFLDTLGCFSEYAIMDTITVEANSPYYNRPCNTLYQFTCSPGYEYLVFAAGLGLVLNEQWGGGCGQCSAMDFDSTLLIYYANANGTERWGTPYYEFTTGLQTIDAGSNEIALYPTINDGNFTVTCSNQSLLPIIFIVYDIMGNEVNRAVLNNSNNQVNLPVHAAGVYIWKAVSQSKLVQTGKFILRE